VALESVWGMGSAWAALVRLLLLDAEALVLVRLVAMDPSHQRWPDGTGSIRMGKGRGQQG
jgi:hypothetical protein